MQKLQSETPNLLEIWSGGGILVFIFVDLLTTNNMDTNNKEHYEAPSTEVLEVKQEGIICASGLDSPSNYPNGVDPFNF